MQQTCPMCGFLSDSHCSQPDGHPQSSTLLGIESILKEGLSDSTILRVTELLKVELLSQWHQNCVENFDKQKMELLRGTSSNGQADPSNQSKKPSAASQPKLEWKDALLTS
jgi:hypothetical protein